MPTHSVTLSVHKLLTLSINIRNTENSVLFSLFSMSTSGLLLLVHLSFLVIIFFPILLKIKTFDNMFSGPFANGTKWNQQWHLWHTSMHTYFSLYVLNDEFSKGQTDYWWWHWEFFQCSYILKIQQLRLLATKRGSWALCSVLLTPKMRKCYKFPTMGPQKRSFSKTQLLFTELLIDGGHITVAQVYPESYYVQWLGQYCQHSKKF